MSECEDHVVTRAPQLTTASVQDKKVPRTATAVALKCVYFGDIDISDLFP